MVGPESRSTLVNPSPRRGPKKLANHPSAAGWLSIILTGLIFSGLLGFTRLVNAGDEQSSLAVVNEPGSPHPHSFDADFVALREYAQQVGGAQPDVVNIGKGRSPHPHYGNMDALREYAQQIEGEQPDAANTGKNHSPHPHYDTDALREYAQQVEGGQPDAANLGKNQSPHPHYDMDVVALREFAQQAGIVQPLSAGPAGFKIARADNALDALREMLQKGAEPGTAPNSAPNVTPKRPIPTSPRANPSFVDAHRLGSQTCLSCHSPQAEAFGQTLMGRISKSQPAKLDCENCHGPGSAHVQAVGCAACHGEGGISKRPGIPSLVGQDPQYLVPAMKAYVTGQRKHDLMRLVLSGLGDAEIQNIASYYARQIPDRAKTPAIGDASAGKGATALCAGCHGDRGASISPMWPSLAGQDAQYLADAIQGYKAGSRSKAIACAGCHGEGGISNKPGMPSLAGMDPQYLVPAMKAYASGDRKHGLMKALISGVDEAQLNSMAQFYARQNPARAQTPTAGDPSAGKNASGLCVGCHGEAGGSVAAAIPSLAGQDAKYLAGAMKAYRDNTHNKTVPCAACHGDKGISKTPGMPSLAGLAPQYLVAAMKAYTGGQRKHEVMKLLLTDVSETALNEMAQYYAGQIPGRAETPSIGDAAAGKALSAPCAGCHGAQGISANPIWPSLAGQDAGYLADALRGYKDGSRNDPVMKGFVAALNEQAINNIASYYATLAPAQPARSAGTQAPAQSTVPAAAPAQASNPAAAVARCAGCHGETGVSKTPGMPSLAGLAPQYLVAAMKAYVGGERKNEVMKGLLTGVSESEINEIAQYYARQGPARAETSSVGDAAAGNALSAPCAGCHGVQGVSANPIWPSLAGQDARYLADALRGYKDGSRDNAMMKGFVVALDDQAINNIASYYATLAPAPAAPAAAAQAPAQPVPPAATPAPAQPAPVAQAPASNPATAVIRCATCHGETGVSKTPGIPSLVGLSPQYFVAALKAYAAGQRTHQVMRSILVGVTEAEFNEMARYYAQQVPARAGTPPVGDAAAGRTLSAACGGCHGAQGVSENPIWPSLAGQDARYLADTLRDYKDGSRDNAMMKGFVAALNDQAINNIASYYATLAPAQPAPAAATQAPAQPVPPPAATPAPAQPVPPAAQAPASNPATAMARCAVCHGETGVSKTPGIPSLAGLSRQYLVAALKAYAAGQRNHQVMRSILVGVTEAELNEMALYYARQVPARAGTPPVGDAAAGRALSAACGGCHSAQGISENPIWPSLAGQDARYLADTLRDYKDGSRNNAVMKGLVAALNDQAINDIASYYSTLVPGQPAPPAGTQAPTRVAPPAAARVPAQSVPAVASPAPAQPAPPAFTTAPTSNRAPALVRNNLLAGLDDRTIADIAAYFASLNPTRSKPSGGQGGGREPVVVRNGLVASLDQQTIRNVASYYASLAPEQPPSARNAPARPDPALVSFTRPSDGSSPGGIVSFRANDPSRRVEQNNAICLTCHERGDRTYWNGSTHETRGLACTQCHTVMRQVSRKAALKTVVEMETCFQCHKDRRAQIFRSSHMPLREGKMTCTNCHNPHGSATEAMLKENSINDTCYKCHAEKRGPFLFEHAPVRENCLSCHDAHGSNTEYMLKVSRPRLCAECHGMGHGSLANGPRTVETFGRSCQNCHTAIHGSNSPSGALLQR